MKQILAFLVLLMTVTVPPVLADTSPSVDCRDTAMTQFDMNQCAAEQLASITKELDAYVSQIKVAHKDNPAFLEKLDQAQKAWEEFKEAQLDLLYFDHNGSVMPMCHAYTSAGLSFLRLEQLKEWKWEEGDVCGGL